LYADRGSGGASTVATSAALQGAKFDFSWRANPSFLLTIALAGCAAATYTVLSALGSDYLSEPGLRAAFAVWVMLPYIFGGLIAWWRRPENRFGPLMVAAGFGTFLAMLGWSNVDVLHTVGQTLNFLPPILFLHVFLAFPTGRLERPVKRAIVGAAYATGIGLGLVRMLLGGFGPHGVFALTTEPGVADGLERVQLVTSSACALAGIGVLVARRLGTGRPLRRSVTLLTDSFAVGLLMIALLAMRAAVGAPGYVTIQRLTYFVVGLAPFAFVIGLLHARLARSSVGDLFLELRGDPAPADLRDALARALRDPSLTLAYWLAEFGSYADHDGRAVELPESDGWRAVRLIERDGVRVAALVHDPALRDEPELLDAVTAAAGIAIEKSQLNVELRARVEELRGSRARIVEAGQRERQRLERNLHDSAQHRLVALSLQLSLLQEQLAADRSAAAQLEHARREIDTSLDELREIARGIHPAVVSAHGLAVALEQLAARAPVPVHLSVQIEGRLPEEVEVAVYYLISESLANIGKHAQASSATVEVARADGQISVEVVDDGVGGADTEGGSGLRGLADRVEALGGRLRVWSPRGGGTRVRAEIPCAS
jgi:signal transduction histidine kinase